MTTESPLNRGAELLRDAGSIAEVAAELGVTTRVVSTWRAGKIPSDDNQTALLAAFEIPRRSWREPATGAESEPGEPEWVNEVIAALGFRYPTALDAIFLHVLEGQPLNLAWHVADQAKGRARHPELYATADAANLALGRAIAAECVGDTYAEAFLAETKESPRAA